MPHASLYRLSKKGFFIYSNLKAVSGFLLAAEPFFHIPENEISKKAIVNSIRSSLSHDDSKILSDPKNWKESTRIF